MFYRKKIRNQEANKMQINKLQWKDIDKNKDHIVKILNKTK